MEKHSEPYHQPINPDLYKNAKCIVEVPDCTLFKLYNNQKEQVDQGRLKLFLDESRAEHSLAIGNLFVPLSKSLKFIALPYETHITYLFWLSRDFIYGLCVSFSDDNWSTINNTIEDQCNWVSQESCMMDQDLHPFITNCYGKALDDPLLDANTVQAYLEKSGKSLKEGFEWIGNKVRIGFNKVFSDQKDVKQCDPSDPTCKTGVQPVQPVQQPVVGPNHPTYQRGVHTGGGFGGGKDDPVPEQPSEEKTFTEKAQEVVRAVGEKIEETYDNVKEYVVGSNEQTSEEKIKDTKDDLAEKGEKAYDQTQQNMKDAGERIKDRTEQTYDQAQREMKKEEDKPNSGDAYDKAKADLKDTGEKISDKTKEVWDQTQQGAENLKEKAMDKSQETKHKMEREADQPVTQQQPFSQANQ